MTSRRSRPIIKTAVLAIVGIAVIAYMVSACSWFDGGPAPISDPDVESGRLVRLTHNDSTETNPVWSPRGDKIAFECMSDGRRGIWPFSGYSAPSGNREVKNWNITSYSYPSNICVMNTDGSGRTQLTDDDTEDYDPAWSPDGSKIAFTSWRDMIYGIDVVNADGSGRIRLTDGQAYHGQPTWSPDGSKIAFASGGYQSNNIYVMNADGSGPRQITRDVFSAEHPTWSPDGSKIAFISFRNKEDDTRLYVVDADGSSRPRVVISPGSSYAPSWSPDGHRIAYLSRTGDDSSIHLVNADGSERTLLYERAVWAESPRYLNSPTWSPDGNRLAFVAGIRRPDGGNTYSDIHTINIDGSGLTRLTDRSGDDASPSWHPDGTKLAFTSDLVGNSEIYVTPYR